MDAADSCATIRKRDSRFDGYPQRARGILARICPLCGASERTRIASPMLANRFVAERVQSAGGDILFELSTPALLIALRNPLRQLAEVDPRQL
jgi:hypothetical protein